MRMITLLFSNFQAVDTLKQISDGSIDDIVFPDIEHLVHSTFLNFEIKEEEPFESDFFANDIKNQGSLY